MDASAPKTPPDLTSILQQVQALQAEKERLQKELDDTRGVNVKLQVTSPARPPPPNPSH